MTRFDTFLISDEFDMLECRLTELQDIPDLVHIAVEGDVVHGDNTRKPYYLSDNLERFSAWRDRLIVVRATDLDDGPDPWQREHGQREWVWTGLRRADAKPDDIIFHGDVDEIPTALAAEYVNPRGVVCLSQRFHPFAVDWAHPQLWPGTTATRIKDLGRVVALRDARLSVAVPRLPDSGWHFSWVGDNDGRIRKMHSFCHPEIGPTWEPHLEECYSSGLHVDGTALQPVTVDASWPKWVVQGHAPANWFRPAVPTERPDVTPVTIIKPSYETDD